MAKDLHRRVQVQQQVKQVKGKGTVLALPKRRKTRSVPLADGLRRLSDLVGGR